MFVNTLLLRNRPANSKGIIEFLREVKKGTLEAFDNQDYQFDDLVEKIGIPRDTSRNPLFDVLFLFSKLDPGTVTILDTTSAGDTGIPGLKIKPYRDEDTRAKFDILFTGRDTGERENLFFLIEYSTELFKRETIERFIENFKEVASAVIKDQSAALMDIVISHDLSLVVSDLQAETEFDF
jgi:non-ribosomal peptide synthetase component F